jgi:hypothetical protein
MEEIMMNWAMATRSGAGAVGCEWVFTDEAGLDLSGLQRTLRQTKS